MLPIGGLYTMGPLEAAHAVRLLGVKRVIPMHFGTFPPLAGRPEELREHCEDEKVRRFLTRGEENGSRGGT